MHFSVIYIAILIFINILIRFYLNIHSFDFSFSLLFLFCKKKMFFIFLFSFNFYLTFISDLILELKLQFQVAEIISKFFKVFILLLFQTYFNYQNQVLIFFSFS